MQGVDIGGLDATIHLGYPGSTASLAQQAGRAGRGGRDAVALLVAADNPMEQHLMHTPRALLERPLERTIINPANAILLRQHLQAAAHEAPLRIPPDSLAAADASSAAAATTSVPASVAATAAAPPCTLAAPVDAAALDGGPLDGWSDEPEPYLGHWAAWRGAARLALDAGELRLQDGHLHSVGGRTPHTAISLRDLSSKSVRLVVVPPEGNFGPEVDLETMEEGVAQLRVYEGAVYMHAGASYLVLELDLTARVARLQRTDVNYYTEPRDHTRVLILNRSDPLSVFGAPAFRGPMRVSKNVYGHRQIAKVGGRLIEVVDAERTYPPIEYDTRGVWLELPAALRDALHANGESYARGGLHALEHLAIGLSPLCATCEPADLGCQCTRRQGDEHQERLLLFERRRGGVGVADALQGDLSRLLQAAQARLETCECEGGCLGCVHMAGCGEYNEGLDKEAAKAILRWLIQGEVPKPRGEVLKPRGEEGGEEGGGDEDVMIPQAGVEGDTDERAAEAGGPQQQPQLAMGPRSRRRGGLRGASGVRTAEAAPSTFGQARSPSISRSTFGQARSPSISRSTFGQARFGCDERVYVWRLDDDGRVWVRRYGRIAGRADNDAHHVHFDGVGDVKAEVEAIHASCVYRFDEESEPPKPRTIVKQEESSDEPGLERQKDEGLDGGMALASACAAPHLELQVKRDVDDGRQAQGGAVADEPDHDPSTSINHEPDDSFDEDEWE